MPRSKSFNGRFREECVNVHWFSSIDDTQRKIDAFRLGIDDDSGDFSEFKSGVSQLHRLVSI